METANFGTFLREQREKRQVSLAELAQSTKLSVSSLKLMEAGNLDDLPPDVFVRGFIRSYAKRLGISSNEPIGMLDQILAERRRAAMPPVAMITPRGRKIVSEPTVPMDVQPEDEAQAPRRGIGLAVFVIIVLLIATITLSLFLRQQPQSGEGLSIEDGSGASVQRSLSHCG
jgi:cytoskeletal protein RodZ